jgi:Arc/MetJ-type ribon-helix-helix transcriptional regulator
MMTKSSSSHRCKSQYPGTHDDDLKRDLDLIKTARRHRVSSRLCKTNPFGRAFGSRFLRFKASTSAKSCVLATVSLFLIKWSRESTPTAALRTAPRSDEARGVAAFGCAVAPCLLPKTTGSPLTREVTLVIKSIISLIIGCVMGAIAVSKKEEEQIERLRKEMRIPTKSEVIRTALRALEKQNQEQKLRREIRESVSRCAIADREENEELVAAGVARKTRGE